MDYGIRSYTDCIGVRYPDAGPKGTGTELTIRREHILEYSPLQSAGREPPGRDISRSLSNMSCCVPVMCFSAWFCVGR